jgi:hypothetical protein
VQMQVKCLLCILTMTQARLSCTHKDG